MMHTAFLSYSEVVSVLLGMGFLALQYHLKQYWFGIAKQNNAFTLTLRFQICQNFLFKLTNK